MISKDDLNPYREREHAKAKHTLLRDYITRYTMILGRSAQKLCFVDGFAGPWQSSSEDRSDTSFGLSVASLHTCAEALGAKFQRRPDIQALWIEEDPIAYAALAEYARNNTSSRVRIETIQAKFEDCITRIADFVGNDAHGFVFIDPKGYAGLIEPDVLAPLLANPRIEVLINYMWSHIRWALNRPDDLGHVANMEKLYGKETSRLLNLSGGDQELKALHVYEQRLRDIGGGDGERRLRLLSYPIRDTRGQRYTKYYLIHGTHDARGLVTFADECQRANRTQEQIFVITQENRREEKTGTGELFHADNCERSVADIPVTAPWLARLKKAGDQLVVDTDVWATMLEDGRCLPNALQLGFKQLMEAGIVSLDAANKRRKHFVHHEKSEIVRRIT